MSKKAVLTSAEVAEILGISKAPAYKIIRKLNNELEAKNYIVVAGKVSRIYFQQRIYGLEGVNEDVDT